MSKVTNYVNGSGSHSGYVQYEYYLSCDGAQSKRLKYDSTGDLEEGWRYEYDGLNLLRMDEVYDSNADTDLDDDLDNEMWRIRETSTHRPGQLGAQLGKRVYEHTGNDATPDGYDDYTYAYDAVGNVVMVFDSAGNEEFHFAQDAFGNELAIAAFGATPWDTAEAAGVLEHQTGKQIDPYTELYYFHARWYDAGVGRFVSKTRLQPDEEGAYIYCEDSPTTWVDLNGREASWPIIGPAWEMIQNLFPDDNLSCRLKERADSCGIGRLCPDNPGIGEQLDDFSDSCVDACCCAATMYGLPGANTSLKFLPKGAKRKAANSIRINPLPV